MANPPPPTADPSTTGQGPAAGPVDDRLAAVEKEQQAQRGLLEQILGRLPGGTSAGPGPTPPAAPAGPAGGVDIAAIQQQVRDEILAADARRAAEQKETKWRDGIDTALEKLRRERQPREPETGVRARVQRMIIGRQP